MTPQQLIKITKALADLTRFHLLQTIASRGETCCGELVPHFPLAQATVSRHLKILTEAGLVGLPWRRRGSTLATYGRLPGRLRVRAVSTTFLILLSPTCQSHGVPAFLRTAFVIPST